MRFSAINDFRSPTTDVTGEVEVITSSSLFLHYLQELSSKYDLPCKFLLYKKITNSNDPQIIQSGTDKFSEPITT